MCLFSSQVPCTCQLLNCACQLMCSTSVSKVKNLQKLCQKYILLTPIYEHSWVTGLQMASLKYWRRSKEKLFTCEYKYFQTSFLTYIVCLKRCRLISGLDDFRWRNHSFIDTDSFIESVLFSLITFILQLLGEVVWHLMNLWTAYFYTAILWPPAMLTTTFSFSKRVHSYCLSLGINILSWSGQIIS